VSSPRRQFRPPWWATLATLAAGGLFIVAGLWQLGRAEQRRALLHAFEQGAATAPIAAPGAAADLQALRYRRVGAAGRYDNDHQVLLDARTRGGRAGYEVLTPLLRAGGPAILVNRGWVAADADRRRLPAIEVGSAPREVVGLLDRLPAAALASEPDAAQGWPRRMLFPTAAQISAALGYPVSDYQLLLAPELADGFLRDWHPAQMTPEQHLGYAAQWFALAAALGVIYVALNLRKIPGSTESR